MNDRKKERKKERKKGKENIIKHDNFFNVEFKYLYD